MTQRTLINLEQVPVFQNKMYRSRTEAKESPLGDICLVQDLDTGLIFNRAYDDELVVYDGEYQNEQAASQVFLCHLQNVYKILEKYELNGTVAEIGCGKGFFLEYLRKKGVNIVGVDPAYEGSNPNIIKTRFDSSLGIGAQMVILRHTLEHIHDPISFIEKIAQANRNKGSIYIEVPAFEWILKNKIWFDVFYEHVNYFRLTDLRAMFGNVYDSGYLFGGQYMYVIAELKTFKTPSRQKDDIVVVPLDFFPKIEVDKADNKKICIWGAAAKGMNFSYHLVRAGVKIDLIVDINPAKHGKFLAGTGLEVSPPEKVHETLSRGDDVYIMNSNYLEEIQEQSGNCFNYIRVDSQ